MSLISSFKATVTDYPICTHDHGDHIMALTQLRKQLIIIVIMKERLNWGGGDWAVHCRVGGRIEELGKTKI
jgi:glyoxylase-like metal-dependent hydrolase (beta-lactamase superfamily II)